MYFISRASETSLQINVIIFIISLVDNYLSLTLHSFSFVFSWVENKKVCDRLISVGDHIKKLIEFWESLPKNKRPSSKSYLNLKLPTEDPLMEFLSFVAGFVEPCLQKY